MPERGGPTTESGILFQNQVAALYLGRLIDPRPRQGYAAVVEVRLEAPPPVTVDDVVIRFGDGHREYIQVKEAVAPGSDAWKKLWQDFAKQRAMDDFTAADRIVLLLGDSPTWARTLRELCERAAGADDEDEWRRRLASKRPGLGKHQKLLEGLEPMLAGHLEDQSPFSLFACCEVRIWDPARITSDHVPAFMPPSSVEPWQLYDTLLSKTGQHARIRKTFTKGPLLGTLAQEGIEIPDFDRVTTAADVESGKEQDKLSKVARRFAAAASAIADAFSADERRPPGYQSDQIAEVKKLAGQLLDLCPADSRLCQDPLLTKVKNGSVDAAAINPMFDVTAQDFLDLQRRVLSTLGDKPDEDQSNPA
jgi:hypothetical protein